MSLKSILGISAALGALAVFAAACSAAPDGSTSTATESSSEAIIGPGGHCILPPIPVCLPPLPGAPPRICPTLCPAGEEFSLPVCHCIPIPDAGSDASSAPDADDDGSTPDASSAPDAGDDGSTPDASSAPDADDDGSTPDASSGPDADDDGSAADASKGCPEIIACTSTNQQWSPTACACECVTPEPVVGCGPFRAWNPALCECVPSSCPLRIACPLEGEPAASDPVIIQCCGPIRPVPVAE